MDARQVAFNILREIDRDRSYTDIALDRGLHHSNLAKNDRSLTTELVYGIIRRQRTLDALIEQLGTKKASQQPPDLRRILHIGLYQLRYLTQVPSSAAVNTSVELAKNSRLGKLSGVVNGVLRQYIRLSQQKSDPLILPIDTVQKLGIFYSFPDWLIQLWLEQFTPEETAQLCEWFDRSPTLDIRINPLKTTIEAVETALIEAGVNCSQFAPLPQALRLHSGIRHVEQLPGFQEGWYTIQDSSAQLVTHLLDPQPDEVIIDACAAPGGKTTHMAELMGDRGKIWACDRTASRLKQVEANIQRLQYQSIHTRLGDSRHLPEFIGIADRVLLDAPCSGLGTLHKRPDIRWRQTPENLTELSQLQSELLQQTATWVKPKGILVYATCTLNVLENERVIENFLAHHPNWQIQPPIPTEITVPFATSQGWIKVLPYQHHMDGFFMVKLVKGS